MQKGDFVWCENEETGVQALKRVETIQVYNLSVEDYHTYYVSGHGVLVHNAECSQGKVNILENGSENGSASIKNVLPNVEKSTINPNKLTGYALNPEHPVGCNKAKVFESALGYNQSNADNLMKQIYEKLPKNEAILGKLD